MLIPAARLSAWGHCTLAPRVGTVVRRVGTFGRAACSVAATFNCEARSVVQRVRSCMRVRSCSAFGRAAACAFSRAARSVMLHVQSRCAFKCGLRSNVARIRTWPMFRHAARSIVQCIQLRSRTSPCRSGQGLYPSVSGVNSACGYVRVRQRVLFGSKQTGDTERKHGTYTDAYISPIPATA